MSAPLAGLVRTMLVAQLAMRCEVGGVGLSLGGGVGAVCGRALSEDFGAAPGREMGENWASEPHSSPRLRPVSRKSPLRS